jgi:hypothetical protein
MICYQSSASHLEAYVFVEEPIKGGLMHQATFLSLATTNIDLEPLTQCVWVIQTSRRHPEPYWMLHE